MEETLTNELNLKIACEQKEQELRQLHSQLAREREEMLDKLNLTRRSYEERFNLLTHERNLIEEEKRRKENELETLYKRKKKTNLTGLRQFRISRRALTKKESTGRIDYLKKMKSYLERKLHSR